jgi:hypothetical protein
MNWIESIRHRQSLRVFGNRSRKVKFPHEFVDLDMAKQVAFVVNMSQFEARDLIVLTDFITKLEEHGKKVLIVEVNLKRKSEPMFNQTVASIFINAEHINWLGFPSTQKMAEVNQWKPEILINLDTSEILTSRFICGLSNAPTRVGRYEEGFAEYYELMLDVAPETQLKTMLQQFETYLKMLQK